MKITLLRHGRPDLELPKKLASKEIVPLIRQYDDAGIAPDSIPPEQSIAVANTVNAVVCSHLLRSIESAQKLTKKDILLSDELFREASLPSSNWTYPRLDTMTWFFIYRSLWLFG